MDRIDVMKIYVRVAELGSFTQAADSLGLAKASTSAAVRELEAELGTRLLEFTVVTYLEGHQPIVASLLQLIGVVEITDVQFR